MAALRIKCKCGKLLGIPAGMEGKKVVCPGCRRAYRVPGAPVAAGGAGVSAAAAPQKSADPPSRIDLELPSTDALASPSELNLLEGIESSGKIELQPPVHTNAIAEPSAAADGGKTCPACGKAWPKSAKICVQCGVDLKTGRSIIMTDDSGLDEVYVRAESTLKWLSWVFPLGMYPVASEAFGTKKPLTVRSISVLTILTSVVFWVSLMGEATTPSSSRDYMLWCGNGKPSGSMILSFYDDNMGDGAAFRSKVIELVRSQRKARESETKANGESANVKSPPEEDSGEEDDALYDASEETLLAAHHSLPPEQQCFGQYHAYQLLTNAFLHSDLMHIAGNLLFLLVFGSRVNALVGNIPSLILYPVLAIAASIAYMISAQHQPPHPALGASGAIMGLAGMYFVFFPVHKVHMAAWIRRGLFGGFQLHLKLFALRGFWVVLFYIAFDEVYTALGVDDNVAHWAHLGGFIAGMIIALILLMTRLVNARGGDLFTAILGRHAWALVGKPR